MNGDAMTLETIAQRENATNFNVAYMKHAEEMWQEYKRNTAKPQDFATFLTSTYVGQYYALFTEYWKGEKPRPKYHGGK